MNWRFIIGQIPQPPISKKLFAITGVVRYDGIRGAGYLEMWNFFPQARYFSRTLDVAGPLQNLQGSSDWRPFVLPFYNKVGGPPPQQLVVNVVLPGRGTVEVVQQPSASNGYTAILEVTDADVGPDTYRFSAYFTPSGSVTSGGEVISSGALLSHGAALLTWRGRVDKDVMITIRGDRARTRTLDGAPPENVQANLAGGGLPAQDATLTLNQRQGRGTITITQQPSSSNNYTAVIRIRDSRQGFGYYDFDIIWP